MVLFHIAQQHHVEAGRLQVTYRAWQSPRVRIGNRYRLGAVPGSIEVLACEPVPAASITDADAQMAGYESAERVIREAARGRPPDLAFPKILYRIEFRYHPEPAKPPVETEQLTSAEAASLLSRLDAIDARSSHGPWTWETLREIGDRPGTPARILAADLGRETVSFKQDVRKLKALGLTLSLLVGYELSPRGQALLDVKEALTAGASSG